LPLGLVINRLALSKDDAGIIDNTAEMLCTLAIALEVPTH